MTNPSDDLFRYLKQQIQMYGTQTYAVHCEQAPTVVSSESMPYLAEPSTMQTTSVDPNWNASSTLELLQGAIHTCTNCALGSTRTNFVFGSGSAHAKLMVIGEAPGADEDEQGLPFVGRAGQLLTKILESISLSRDEVYICNILKCRPPNNRKPLISETDQCEPYLWKQIDLVKPKFILALGLTAANTLLKNKESMTNLRGTTHYYQGIQTLVTYHPAALLRNPEWKKLAWEDMKFLRNLLDAL